MVGARVITVFGATGAQGGGLVRAILDDPESGFSVRAVTRDPGSDRARELARLGAEVVRADLDDEATLGPVLEGAYGAYLVTNFWEHMSAEREKRQAASLARATGHAGVQHAIWSTLEDTRECVPLDDDRMPTLQGSYKVPHFDAKAEADHFFPEAGAPTTFLRTTFYWENLYSTFAPQRGEDGVLRLVFPMGDSPLSGIAVDDIGRTALAVFKRGTDLIGATVGIAGEHLPVADIAAALTDVVGEPVRYAPMEPDAFRALGFPAADEIGNMFQYYAECADRFTHARDLAAIRALNPSLQDFATWLAGHREAFRSL
ncbi:NmrA/HSCARG family protein [Streptomyces sp. A1136]|uniref:NmrA/HSCARG family protein n=1 Tax=Streptomyces sp. A1136 TaxID=2563102 RepID=UPI00109E971F|nr:NmrA/HSCARG family protein [Streptomyces sp. A1136]THA50393.1 NmrA/HSCARG family protein [Streptomyces sp. A1136]